MSVHVITDTVNDKPFEGKTFVISWVHSMYHAFAKIKTVTAFVY